MESLSTAGDLGPSDGTVVVTPATGNWAVSLTSIGGNLEEVVGAVNSEYRDRWISSFSLDKKM